MNASRDENDRPTIICASKNDGKTIVAITANPMTRGISISDGTSGVDNGNNNGNAMLDENGIAVWSALSSDGSGAVIEIYGDPLSGAVLINSL